MTRAVISSSLPPYFKFNTRISYLPGGIISFLVLPLERRLGPLVLDLSDGLLDYDLCKLLNNVSKEGVLTSACSLVQRRLCLSLKLCTQLLISKPKRLSKTPSVAEMMMSPS